MSEFFKSEELRLSTNVMVVTEDLRLALITAVKHLVIFVRPICISKDNVLMKIVFLNSFIEIVAGTTHV